MAKEKPPADSEEKRLKKEKKEKKRSETDGVHKTSKKDKTDKKEKKEKKESSKKDHKKSIVVIQDEAAHEDAPATTNGSAVRETAADEMQMTTQLLNTLEGEKPGSVVIKEDEDVDVKVRGAMGGLLGALVPFANPLADEKAGKKVLKGVKRGMSIDPLVSVILSSTRRGQLALYLSLSFFIFTDVPCS